MDTGPEDTCWDD